MQQFVENNGVIVFKLNSGCIWTIRLSLNVQVES